MDLGPKKKKKKGAISWFLLGGQKAQTCPTVEQNIYSDKLNELKSSTGKQENKLSRRKGD